MKTWACRKYRRGSGSKKRKEEIEKFMKSSPCNSCKGKRLKPVVLAVHVLNKNIIDVTDLSIEQAEDFIAN